MAIKTAAVFCERWHDLDHRPSDVITEATARRRDGRGKPYVVVPGEPTRPDAIVDVNWSLDYIGVWFLDEKPRRYLKYSLHRVEPETLFLSRNARIT